MSSESAPAEVSIREAFLHGQKLQSEVENSDLSGSDPEYQARVLRAIVRLNDVLHLARQLSLFSANEEADDISTADLRYVLADAYLGDLIARRNISEPHARIKLIDNSLQHYAAFLEKCHALKLASERDVAMFKAALESGVASGNPGTERAAKIERFKREKEAKERARAITERLAEEAKRAGSGEGALDEEVDRDLVKALIDMWIVRAIDAAISAHQERQILEHMAKGAPEPKHKPPARPPMKPFVLTRDMVQRGVFGAGYPSLPTMSFEAWAEREMANGTLPMQGGNVNQAPKEEDSEEEEEETDDKLRKARAMDDWKDENKRGSGNMYNRG